MFSKLLIKQFSLIRIYTCFSEIQNTIYLKSIHYLLLDSFIKKLKTANS